MVISHHHLGELLYLRIRRLFSPERARRAVGLVGVIEQGNDVGVREVGGGTGFSKRIGRYGGGVAYRGRAGFG